MFDVTNYPTLNPSLVGKKIARGGHHDVYEYGNDQVLKVPHKPFRFLYSDKQSLLRDLAILHHYIPDFVVPTEVIEHRQKTAHVILQTKIDTPYFLDAKTVPLVRESLTHVLKQQKKLLKEKQMAIDFLGGNGVLSFFRSFISRSDKTHCSNILVVKTDNSYTLMLVDTELLRMKFPNTVSYYAIAVFVLSHVSYILNRILLKWKLGVRVD